MTRLFKNMLEGAGSIINLFPRPEYESPIQKHKTAADAMASDWQAIGRDMQKAMDKVASEIKQTRR